MIEGNEEIQQTIWSKLGTPMIGRADGTLYSDIEGQIQWRVGRVDLTNTILDPMEDLFLDSLFPIIKLSTQVEFLGKPLSEVLDA